MERVVVETYRARTFTLRLAKPRPFTAGQHYDVRLTAPDGYQAQRSYSVASPPSGPTGTIDLTVELIPDGEVSPYFHEVVQPGDVLEVRGPIGGPFTWTAEMGGPLLLVAGGSGIVPLRSILAHREAIAGAVPALLLYSVRTSDDIIYRAWLDALPQGNPSVRVSYTLTRQQPAGWVGYSRRIDPAMLQECLAELATLNGDVVTPLCYVCGPTGFVETAADALLAVGIPEPSIRTERFGPTS
ncbi:MAG: ferredoxin reductase [Chloroflexota bacterium]|nr:ferredoxin reductase [Chloroflexota bacterium]MDE2683058.1 ferredoxin reductase [Chloroflexota bacterium]